MNLLLLTLTLLLTGIIDAASLSLFSTGGGVCKDAACKAAAAFIKAGINATADPCDDFFEFACGGWIARHPVPASKTQISVDKQIEDEMVGVIRTGLEQTSNHSSHAVNFASKLFRHCNESTNDIEFLQKAFKPFGGWRIGTKLGLGSKSVPWHETYVKAYTNLATTAVFSISFAQDEKNVSDLLISIDPSPVGLGEEELINPDNNTEVLTAYRKYISQSGRVFCKANCAHLPADVQAIVELERKLAESRMPQEDRRDPEKTYNKLTIGELSNQTEFDWFTHILQPIFTQLQVPYNLTEDEQILASDPNYLKAAVALLNEKNGRAFENYVGWQVVQQSGPLASEHLRGVKFEFDKVQTGVQEISTRDEFCFKQVDGELSWATSRLFIDSDFSEAEKKGATEVVDEIHEAYQDLLRENEWLDSATKNASLAKLSHVRKNVAFPEWLLNNTALDEFFGLDDQESVDKVLGVDNPLEGLVNLQLLQLGQTFSVLHQKVSLDYSWPMPPAIVNAAYEPEQNSITIPAGILKLPYFEHGRPSSLNFGAIGAVVGHELTHGLDDEGRQYDAEGNLKHWWSPDAIDKFTNRSKCFVQQYSQQVDPVTKLHIKGQNTLGENIADNGGVREAFRAFQTYQKEHGADQTLEGLEYDPDQLFFIAYGQSWCTQYRPEQLKLRIEYDVHSPVRYRVNIPVANTAHFATAFKCPDKAPLNPHNRCLLW